VNNHFDKPSKTSEQPQTHLIGQNLEPTSLLNIINKGTQLFPIVVILSSDCITNQCNFFSSDL